MNDSPDSHPEANAATSQADDGPVRLDTEAALRETEARLAAVVRLLHAGVFEWDLRANKGFWSDENYRLMGIAPGSVAPSPELFLACVHPDDRPQVQETMARALSGLGPLETAHRIIRPDGSVRWINETGIVVRDASGAPIKFSGITLDVTAQREAEQRQREAEMRMARTLEALRAGVWDWDSATETLSWSDEIYRQVGLEPGSEPARDAFFRTIHPDDRAATDEALQRALSTGVIDHERRVVLPDGRVRWLATLGARAAGESGGPIRFSGIAIDVTARRTAEEDARAARERAVRRSEAQNAISQVLGSAETADEAIPRVLRAAGEWLEWDFGELWLDATGSGRLRYAGAWSSSPEAFAPFEGVSRRLLLERGQGIPGRVWDTGHPVWADDVTTLDGFARAVSATDCGLKASFAVPVVRRGTVVGVLQFFSREQRLPDRELLNMFTAFGAQFGQFLERVDAREALRESERQMRDVIDTALDAVIAIDAAGNIADWNPQAERIFGWSIAEVVGKPLDEVIIPERYRERHRRGLQHYHATGEGPALNQRLEMEALHRDGYVFPVELSIATLRPWSGPVDGLPDHSVVRRGAAFSAFVRDISARRQTEAALHEAKDQAEAAARARAEFLAVMSHEIRTPLNGVIGMINLVLKTGLTNDQRDQLNIARRSADLLLAVTNDALDFSKIEAGRLLIDRTPFDLDELVHDVTGTVRPQVRPGVELSVVFDGYRAGAVIGDPIRLRQILVNLVGNAAKFTRHGFVRLRVHADPPHGDEAIPFRFVIEDSGIGIPADKHETIFEAFAQADSSTTRRFGGTGLGLPISKRLAVLMDGALRLVRSTPEGSVFELSLGLRSATHVQPEAGEPATARVSAHILVVDDNAVNRAVASTMLRHIGCSVDVAEDGRQALERLEQTRYDLVLMDCQMPEMDGFEATREARRRGFRPEVVPIIAMTARALPEDRQQSLASGMDDHLNKPLLEETLVAMLRKWLPLDVSAPPTTAAGATPPAASAGPASGAGILDVDQVLRTRELMDDLPGSWDALVDSFVGTAYQTVAAMAEACDEARPTDLRRAAHSLKGSAGMIGAIRLAGWCADLEHAVDQAQAQQCARLVARIREEIAVVANGLRTGVLD